MQIYYSLQSRCAKPQVRPRGQSAARESLRRSGRVHPRELSGRPRQIRQAAASPAIHPFDRSQMPRARILLQVNRRCTGRKLPHGNVGIKVGSLGAEGVPHFGAHRYVKRKRTQEEEEEKDDDERG